MLIRKEKGWRACEYRPKLALPEADGVHLSWPSQSHSHHPPSRTMITPPLLLLMSSPLLAFHLTHVPILSRPPLPLVPFYLPYPFYLLQERTDEIVHEFRHILLFPSSTNKVSSNRYLCRCPGPGRFPSSSDCSHFWECLGEDQVRPKCFTGQETRIKMKPCTTFVFLVTASWFLLLSWRPLVWAFNGRVRHSW